MSETGDGSAWQRREMALFPDTIAVGANELRRWRIDHLEPIMDAIVAYLPELQAWLPWAAGQPDRDAEVAALAAGVADFDADRGWSYCLRSPDGTVLGSAGVLDHRAEGHYEIGYWMRTDRARRGLATGSAAALTTTAFAVDPAIDLVKIRMDAENYASAAVPRKLGYRFDRAVPHALDAPAQTGTSWEWVIDRATWVRR